MTQEKILKLSIKDRIAGRFSARGVNRTLLGLPYLWLLLFFLAPFAFVVKISLSEIILAAPPYQPWFNWAEDAASWINITFDNYVFVFQDRLYLFTYWNSLKTAAISTALVLFIGYPMAYAIARAPRNKQGLLLMLVIIPFWTSFLLRIYALTGLLNTHGLINKSLMALGVIDDPLRMMYTDFAIYTGIVYSYLPFMILPLYATLEKLDVSLLDAASDLGAGPIRSFIDITLPLSLPGIIAGCMLVFIPAMGEFVIPSLLGGAESPMIGRVLYEEFFINRDWPLSSAIAVVLLILLLLPIAVLRRYQDKEMTA
jgi:putrescine transport system permease protein